MSKYSLLAAIAVATVAMVVMASSASAHARRKSSVPAAGEVLAISPATVDIEFTQDVQKISGTYGIEVADAAGSSVTTGEAAIAADDRSRMSVPLQPGLAPGRYVVTYHNVSDADGDEFEASFAFYVGVQPTGDDLAADQELADAEGTGEEATPGTTPPPNSTASPVATATPIAVSEDDGGGSNTAVVVIVVLVAAAAGIGIGFVGYRVLRRSQ